MNGSNSKFYKSNLVSLYLFSIVSEKQEGPQKDIGLSYMGSQSQTFSKTKFALELSINGMKHMYYINVELISGI